MEGVELYSLKHITIPNGDIYHALKATDKGYKGFGEAYFSCITPKNIKGWKRHNRITLNLIVPVGAIKFVIYDDRTNSQTKGQFTEYTLSPETNYSRLSIAPGLWMAFAGVASKESILLDIIDEPHNPEEADRKELSEISYNFNL